MILTDYYRFERVAKKAKHRMDCTASTESYPEFENRRATKAYRETEKRDAIKIGDLIIYWVIPDNHMRADRKRKGYLYDCKEALITSLYGESNKCPQVDNVKEKFMKFDLAASKRLEEKIKSITVG